MEITLLKIKEIPILAGLYMKFIHVLKDECCEPYFNYTEDIEEKLSRYFKKCLKNPHHAIYLARINNEVAGFIAGDMRPSFFPYAVPVLNGYISAVYIEKKFRRKGLTRKLEQHICENFFSRHNAEYVELHCLVRNTKARNTWKKLGYNPFREQLRKSIR